MTGRVPAEAVRVARLAERRKAGPLGFAGDACLAVIVMINQAPCAALSNRLAASADSRTSPECRRCQHGRQRFEDFAAFPVFPAEGVAGVHPLGETAKRRTAG